MATPSCSSKRSAPPSPGGRVGFSRTAVPSVENPGRGHPRPRALSYGCRCSRARLAGVLQGFPEDDLDHMAQEDGAITMTCEFCNLDFRFDRAEIRGGA